MMKRLVPLSLAVLILFPAAMHAQTVLTATLSGVNEPDGGDPDGSGFAVLSFNGTTINYFIVERNLSTTTGAHIHRLSSGAIVVPFNNNFDNGVAIGTVTASSQGLVDEILANPSAFYVNVHSSEKPNGAIRGNLNGGVGVSGQDAPSTCSSSDTALCLNGNRFKVETTWKTAAGATGTGHAVRLTADSGYFWFFNADNVEMTVKSLNACAGFNSQWVFASGLTNVEVALKVTDTVTGKTRTYNNPQAAPFQAIQDTSAFGCP